MKKYIQKLDILYFVLGMLGFLSPFYLFGTYKYGTKLTHIFAKSISIWLVVVLMSIVLINVIVRKKIVKIFLKILIVSFFSCVISIYFVQDSMVFIGYYMQNESYMPDIDTKYETLENDETLSQIQIESKGTTLTGWIKNCDKPNAPILIIFNGNGGFAGYTMEMYSAISDELNIVLFDYRGYGKSEGIPNQNNVKEDALAIIDYFCEDENYKSSEIYVLGYSIGTEIATYAAVERQLDGLILVTPFDDFVNVYNEMIDIFHGPFRWLVKYQYSPMRNVKNADEDILILCSDNDGMFSPQMAENIQEEAKGNVHIYNLIEPDHNSYFAEAYRDITSTYIVDFIKMN